MASAVDETIAEFTAHLKSMRCKDVCKALEKLGFTIRTGAGPGHKMVRHTGLAGFTGSNFNCPGKNAEVVPQYIRNLIAMLQKWREEIEAQHGK